MTSEHRKYDNETLQKINESVDLVEYARNTMELERRGDDYFAHCPNHIDNTASLSFSPDKNLYYCFSCGCSGGIIRFLMDFEKMPFTTAVEKAAKLANLDLSKICYSDTISFLRQVKSLHKSKIRLYEHPILNAREYEKYKKDAITEWLNEGIKQNVLDLFNVRVDDFKNRIVYPVYDIKSNLINIKGRTRYTNYKELKIPKYINYFTVGVMDYFQCLNLTLPFIKEKNEIIIFESIKSVMLAYGWGYKNCVSAEKHTLTLEQINLLVKLKVNIVFAFDNDVDYRKPEVKRSIDRLKSITNVYVIYDKRRLLGGRKTKNSPVDCGLDIWEQLYLNKAKVM